MLPALPAQAARPLLDTHQWDAYFALFARDAVVPWKPVTIRLDTFSGAPVDFSAYAADPADVIIAGRDQRSRSLDTSHLTPVARWRFTPPPGYHFESSDVQVPLQNREGFYVIEARRGDAVQQVWLDITRLGLVAEQGPDGLLLYTTDLSSGRALPGVKVTWLVDRAFSYSSSDEEGLVRPPAGARPSFALAEWGKSKTFISILPVAPAPQAIVGVRSAQNVVRAGESVDVVGFVRKRVGPEFRAADGSVDVTIAGNGRTLGSQSLALDAAGAFAGALAIPRDAPAGDYAILAAAQGATGGSTIHVDASSDIRIAIRPQCGATCASAAQLPVELTITRDGQPAANLEVHVRVVRSPHVAPPGHPDEVSTWGTTEVMNTSVRTDGSGRARVTIPAPSDGLDSTYGLDVSAGEGAESARIVTTTTRYAIAVHPDQASLDVGQPAGVDVYAFDPTDGSPAAGKTVDVLLSHGTNSEKQSATLDADGRAHLVFQRTQLGSNLVLAQLAVEGARAQDAAEVDVAPRAVGGRSGASASVSLAFDRPRYKPGDRITVTASLPGAIGVALLTLQGGKTLEAHAVPVKGGRASGTLTVVQAAGDLRVGVVFVRDGATVTADAPVTVDGPGDPRLTALAADRSSYAPGAVAHLTIKDEDLRGATVAVRVAEGSPSAGAGFVGVPDILAVGGSSTQSPTSDDPAWHAWVAPASSKAADIFSFDRPPAGASKQEPSLALAAGRALFWHVDRMAGDSVDVQLPRERGRYVISILKIADDGDVGAASVTVQVE